jgi:hypothetical protein
MLSCPPPPPQQEALLLLRQQDTALDTQRRIQLWPQESRRPPPVPHPICDAVCDWNPSIEDVIFYYRNRGQGLNN